MDRSVFEVRSVYERGRNDRRALAWPCPV